jgi:hypothetical protein
MSEALLAIAEYLREREYRIKYISEQDVQEIRGLGPAKPIMHVAGRVTQRVEVYFYGLLACIDTCGHQLTIRRRPWGLASSYNIYDPSSFEMIRKYIDEAIDQRASEMARTDYIASCDG